jgi:hypothetical protein
VGCESRENIVTFPFPTTLLKLLKFVLEGFLKLGEGDVTLLSFIMMIQKFEDSFDENEIRFQNFKLPKKSRLY